MKNDSQGINRDDAEYGFLEVLMELCECYPCGYINK